MIHILAQRTHSTTPELHTGGGPKNTESDLGCSFPTIYLWSYNVSMLQRSWLSTGV